MKPLRSPRRRNACENEALVMHAIATANAPLSAYDIARATCRTGSPMVPAQVYRSLTRLIERGQVLRIESLNAYLRRDGESDACLICEDCNHVRMIAMPVLRACMGEVADGTGFAVEQCVIEVRGHCPDCLARARAPAPTSPESRKAFHDQQRWPGWFEQRSALDKWIVCRLIAAMGLHAGRA